MAAATSLPIAVVNQANLDRIENFLNDTAYKEIIESSNNFNTRLNVERRMRLPFIDNQTGVAQNPCSLFMSKRQRLPGLLPGQIYSYPRQRWRKKRRQYLTMSARAYARAAEGIIDGESDIHNISQIENPALQDTDSKDSQFLKDDMPKEWFYDEQDMLEMDAYDEPDPDSDLDYEETYKGRRRGKGRGRGGRGGSGGGGGAGVGGSTVDSPGTPGRKRGAGRGRGKKSSFGGHNYEPTPGDPDKPFACELCGARYKTRPGLTYHYRHSHIEGASEENSHDSNATSTPPTGGTPTPPQQGAPLPPQTFAGGLQQQQQPGGPAAVPPPGGVVPSQDGSVSPSGGIEVPPSAGTASPSGGHVYQDSYVSFLNQSPGTPSRRGGRQPGAPPEGGPPMVGGPQTPAAGASAVPPTLPPNLPSSQAVVGQGDDPPMPVLKPEKMTEGPGSSAGSSDSQPPPGPLDNKKSVAPSPYCDFCLGDSNQNKKTGGVEELVSCSDCGRSGEEINRLRSEMSASNRPEFGQMPRITPTVESNVGSNSWHSGESSGQMLNDAGFGPLAPNIGPPVNVWQEENANFGPILGSGQPVNFGPRSIPSHFGHFGPIEHPVQPTNFAPTPNPGQFGNFGPTPNPGQFDNFGPMLNPGHSGNYGPTTSHGSMSQFGHVDNFGPMSNAGHLSNVGPKAQKPVKTPGKRGRKKKVPV